MRRLLSFASLLALLLTATPSRLDAQPKKGEPILVPPPQAPSINSPFPLGVQRGTTLELTLTGTNLADPTACWTSFPAKVSIPTDANNGKDPAKLRVRLEVPADAPLGVHQIRLATKLGLSNARAFCVDELPQVVEAEDNRTKEKAQVLPVPCVVAGRIDVETSDFYKVTLKPGQRVCFEAVAHRLGTPLDPNLVLHDARSGRELPGLYADDSPGLQTDARLTHTFKEGGEFLVELRDTTHRGGGDFHYRLRICDCPSAIAALPVAVKRGTKASVAFTGPDVEGVSPVEVAAPTDPTQTATDAVPRRNGVAGWPVPVRFSDFDELVEQEPNDAPPQAQKLTLPCGVTGRFLARGDLDCFVFAAKKGQKFRIAAEAYEIHSPAEVLMVLKDAKGGELAKTDPQKPTRIDFTAPADGDFTLVLEHLNYLHGPNEVYRLTVEPAAPDFDLVAGLDRFEAPAGGTALVPIASLTRRDFGGPIEVSVVGHPGISGSVTIEAGKGGPAFLPLTVKPDLAPGAYELFVQAKGTVDGKEVVRLASVAELVRTRMSNLPFPPPRSLTSLGVAVTDKPLFALTTKFAHPEAARGVPLSITLSADRAAGFEEPITLAAIGFPPNVTPAVKPVEKGKGESLVVLTVAPNAPLGSFPVTFRGTAKRDKQDFAYYAAAATLTIVAPFELKVENTPLTLKPGEKAKLKVTVARKGGYRGPVDVELKNLPAGVTAPKSPIPEGKDSVEIEVAAGEKAAAGEKKDVSAQGTATGAANQQVSSGNFMVTVGK